MEANCALTTRDTRRLPVLLQSYFDINQLVGSHPLLSHRYVQLSRGQFHGKMLGVPLPHGIFWRSTANLGGYGTGPIPAGYLMVALVGPGATEQWHGQPMLSDWLALGNWDTGIEHRAGDRHEVLAWLIRLEPFLERAESLGLSVPDLSQLQPLLCSLSGRVSHLRSVIGEFLAPVERNRGLIPVQSQWFETALIEGTLHCLAEEGRPGRAGLRLGLSAARIARDFLHRCVRAPLSASDLCQQLNLPERTLRHYFQATYGTSPKAYHQALRLNLVRSRLLVARQAQGTVSKTATEFGFWHMGRFGQQYLALFGEAPSQTLGQPRARTELAPQV